MLFFCVYMLSHAFFVFPLWGGGQRPAALNKPMLSCCYLSGMFLEGLGTVWGDIFGGCLGRFWGHVSGELWMCWEGFREVLEVKYLVRNLGGLPK